jgi:hypothetical protein
MSCAGAPPSLKKTLAALKEKHQTQKHHLDRGAQRSFFEKIWNRLHTEDEAMGEVGQMASV